MSYLDDVFGPAGVLAGHFPGYTPRPGQVALASAVDRAIREGEHLVAEAPTGTGKSIAYSVPATYWAARDRIKVIIVTANIALQEQLAKKDLPFLKKVLPWSFEFALLKGRNNYLCVDRFENGYREPPLERDVVQIRQVTEWARQTERGDKSELLFEPEKQVWQRFAVTSEDCHGKDCEFAEVCYANTANQKAQLADVVVTNYHLFFADMQVRDMTGDNAFILPRYDVAILDEGHEAVEIARDFFGSEVTEGALRRAGSLLPTELRDRLDDHARDFFADLRNFRRSPAYRARLRTPNAVVWDQLALIMKEAGDVYGNIIGELYRGREWMTIPREERKKITRHERRAERLHDIHRCVEQAMTLPKAERPADQRVHFIEEDGDRVRLCSRPVHVAEQLARSLFETTSSVSITSATLAVGGGFDYLVKEVGLAEFEEPPQTLLAESPFTWSEQALLVTPSGLPDPTKERDKHAKLVAETCAEVIKQADGRTLGLFTSNRGVNEAYRLAIQTGYRILRQGEMPRTKLIDEFRKDVHSVLLGTTSFWTGVDVQGESLSCVFIDRLPFTPPDDPVMSALEEQDRNCFSNYSVPRAIIAFKQGFGRLIRAASDRGVVVCMDGRLTTKSYGRRFLTSLPPVSRSTDIGDVGRFLRGEQLKLQGAPLVVSSGSGVGRSLFDGGW